MNILFSFHLERYGVDTARGSFEVLVFFSLRRERERVKQDETVLSVPSVPFLYISTIYFTGVLFRSEQLRLLDRTEY